jgi:hypothetical protein
MVRLHGGLAGRCDTDAVRHHIEGNPLRSSGAAAIGPEEEG